MLPLLHGIWGHPGHLDTHNERKINSGNIPLTIAFPGSPDINFKSMGSSTGSLAAGIGVEDGGSMAPTQEWKAGEA